MATVATIVACTTCGTRYAATSMREVARHQDCALSAGMTPVRPTPGPGPRVGTHDCIATVLGFSAWLWVIDRAAELGVHPEAMVELCVHQAMERAGD